MDDLPVEGALSYVEEVALPSCVVVDLPSCGVVAVAHPYVGVGVLSCEGADHPYAVGEVLPYVVVGDHP